MNKQLRKQKRQVHKERRHEAQERWARKRNGWAQEAMVNPLINWFVIFVLSGHEFQAQRILDKWGARAYLPLCAKWRRLNRYQKSKIKISYPMTAGCMFLGLRPDQERWLELFQTCGSLYCVLGVDGQPTRLDGSRLERFLLVNHDKLVPPDEEQFMHTHREFTKGDTVEVLGGPFDGHKVRVEDIRGRLGKVALEVFGSERLIDIDLDKLIKAA